MRIFYINLIKSSLLGAFALSFNTRSVQPVLEEFFRLGLPVPWYSQGETKITYNFCDMCPWRCGIIVKSVGGMSHKETGRVCFALPSSPW